ncbi:MAG: hypothetical protein LIP03_15370 [Bacteroidales bacterium]|nr:hypothetical protein [Bacteroidales bacterium]
MRLRTREYPNLCLLLAVMGGLASCDTRASYLEDDQIRILSLLTAHEWVDNQVGNLPNGTMYISTSTWKFNSNCKGSYVIQAQTNDDEPILAVIYFDWAFTTPNYAVICLYLQGSGEQYWLINELTSSVLDVTVTQHDPVYYPNQYPKVHHRFQAVDA